jgi:hypothetical protein
MGWIGSIETMRKTFLAPGWTAGFLLGLATVVAPAQVPSPAPSGPPKTNDPQAAALDLLRRVIAEQQRNPNKIIRVPGDAAAVPAPSRDSKPSAASTGPRLTRAELERQFLEGKISAKQFQRAAEDLERNPPPPAPPPPAHATTANEKPAGSAKDPATAALSPRASSALPGKVVTNQPSANPPATAGEDPEEKAFADVEAKIDEILARRHAINQAAKTNDVSTNAAAAGPLTKRQKLDGLLRQLIQGKLTEQEYNAQREKVLAQPD